MVSVPVVYGGIKQTSMLTRGDDHYEIKAWKDSSFDVPIIYLHFSAIKYYTLGKCCQ